MLRIIPSKNNALYALLQKIALNHLCKEIWFVAGFSIMKD